MCSSDDPNASTTELASLCRQLVALLPDRGKYPPRNSKDEIAAALALLLAKFRKAPAAGLCELLAGIDPDGKIASLARLQGGAALRVLELADRESTPCICALFAEYLDLDTGSRALSSLRSSPLPLAGVFRAMAVEKRGPVLMQMRFDIERQLLARTGGYPSAPATSPVPLVDALAAINAYSASAAGDATQDSLPEQLSALATLAQTFTEADRSKIGKLLLVKQVAGVFSRIKQIGVLLKAFGLTPADSAQQSQPNGVNLAGST